MSNNTQTIAKQTQTIVRDKHKSAAGGWVNTPIAEIEVKPAESPSISLGIYHDYNPPKGFSVEIAPDPAPIDSIISTIKSVGTPKQYELFLSIVNNSNRVVSAEVHKL